MKIMVEKKVKDIDPEYYTNQAVEKKQSNLFSKARTRKSVDLHEEEDAKKTIIKKEKRKIGFTQFDATGR